MIESQFAQPFGEMDRAAWVEFLLQGDAPYHRRFIFDPVAALCTGMIQSGVATAVELRSVV
jgi:hypothetical protein